MASGAMWTGWRSPGSSPTSRCAKRPKPWSPWRANGPWARATTARWSWFGSKAEAAATQALNGPDTSRSVRRLSALLGRLDDSVHCRRFAFAPAMPGFLRIALDGGMLAQGAPRLQRDPVEFGLDHPALGMHPALAVAREEAPVATGDGRRPASLPLLPPLLDQFESLAGLRLGVGPALRMARQQDRGIRRAHAAREQHHRRQHAQAIADQGFVLV